MRYIPKQSAYKALYLKYKKENRLLKRYSYDITRRHRILTRQMNKANKKSVASDREVFETRLSNKLLRISSFTYLSVVSAVAALLLLNNYIKSNSLIESLATTVLYYLLFLFALWILFILWINFVGLISQNTKFKNPDDIERYNLTGILSFLLSPVFVIALVLIIYLSSNSY